MYDQSTTGSLSALSRVSHAAGRRAASTSYHDASRLDFPKPAGQATSVSDPPDAASSRRSSLSLRTVASRTRGAVSLVSIKTLGSPLGRGEAMKDPPDLVHGRPCSGLQGSG